MVSLFRLLTLAAAAVVLLGCASFRGAPLWDPATTTTLASTDPLFDSYVTRLFKETVSERRVAVRDEFITVRMAQLDRVYDVYKQQLYSQKAGSAVGLDAAMLTLAAIAATVSDAGTAAGAAALAGVLAGSRASFDKNAFFDQTLPAIISQMDAQRSVSRARIFAGQLLNDSAYSMNHASSDLSEYFQAGTIHGAVGAITTQAGQAKTAAEKVLRDRLPSEEQIRAELTKKGFRVDKAANTNTTEQLKKCFSPDGAWDPKIEAPLNAWFEKARPGWAATLPAGMLPATPNQGVELSNFSALDAYEPLRQLAFADATLGPLLRQCNNPVVGPTETPK